MTKIYPAVKVNSKNPPWNLQTRILKLLDMESTSDVEFIVGATTKSFHCHKIILAAGSVVFNAMFFGAVPQKSPVCLTDVTARGFDIMIQYLYGDEVSIQDAHDALETAYVSKKYMIKSLFQICENFLLGNVSLNVENVFQTYEEASFLEMSKLCNHCLRYISRNAKKLFHERSFALASKGTFEDILGLEHLHIETEVEIIEALWLWGKEQCKQNGAECSIENIRECTKEFLKYIRFYAMEHHEIVSILGRCQILDMSEEMELLLSIAMPRTVKIPSNISTESRPRSISNSTKVEFPVSYRYDGNMTSFIIQRFQTRFTATLTGTPVTVIGAVISFRPIPCYSSRDRSLDVEISVINSSSNFNSTVKSQFKAESLTGMEHKEQLLLLDSYVVIEDGTSATITVTIAGEGIRLMQCTKDEFIYDSGKSKLNFRFEDGAGRKTSIFPIKELVIL